MRGHRDVYFARCICPDGSPVGAIKIGCSYGWESRIKAVASGQPYTLEIMTTVPGDMVMEQIIHLYLKAHRISGEFFHDNEAVCKFVEDAKTNGSAFHYLTDKGDLEGHQKAAEVFMGFHEISLKEVCELLGVPLKQYEGKLAGKKNRRLIAATMLIAGSRQQYATWPDDALRGAIGEKAPAVIRRKAKAVA